MAIIAESGPAYEPAPEGTHSAVCCDVVDLGFVENQWGTKHFVQVRWQIDYLRGDDLRYELARRFTLSLHEKSALRPFLEAWRGKQFTEAELRGFDLEKLLDVACLLNVVHQEREGRIYAHVTASIALPKGADRISVEGYVRVQDRAAEEPEDEGQGEEGLTF